MPKKDAESSSTGKFANVFSLTKIAISTLIGNCLPLDVNKEASRIADKHHIPVDVTFQWRENDKAQHPGRTGVLRAGK